MVAVVVVVVVVVVGGGGDGKGGDGRPIKQGGDLSIVLNLVTSSVVGVLEYQTHGRRSFAVVVVAPRGSGSDSGTG